MISISPSINYIFILTTFLTVALFYKASHNSKTALIILSILLLTQGALAYTGFYTDIDSLPPRFIFLAPPSILIIALLFISNKGRRFIDELDLKTLTIIHTIRIPVEIILYLLCKEKMVPELMTFTGRNWDILSGLSAPVIFWYFNKKQQESRKILLVWNIICLALLFNVVINAVLSVPSPVQQFALDQPNVAVLFFPFCWLPAVIVPIVFLSHLASIRQLLK